MERFFGVDEWLYVCWWVCGDKNVCVKLNDGGCWDGQHRSTRQVDIAHTHTHTHTQTHQDDDPKSVIDKDSPRHPKQEAPHNLVRLCVCVCIYMCMCLYVCMYVHVNMSVYMWRPTLWERRHNFFFDLCGACGGLVCVFETDRQTGMHYKTYPHDG